eukprot:364459-Chlamydomonas_euryale.AAC.3
MGGTQGGVTVPACKSTTAVMNSKMSVADSSQASCNDKHAPTSRTSVTRRRSRICAERACGCMQQLPSEHRPVEY